MNFSQFIASRIRKTQQHSFSATVTKIGIASIAIGLAVMIISFGVLLGFKSTIKEKLFSLSAHLQVSKVTLNQSFEETPMTKKSKFYENFHKNPFIRHVQAVANKAGMMKSKEELAGIMVKGIGQDFDWVNFNQNLLEGHKINFKDTTYSNEIIISQRMANQLKIKNLDDVLIYFIQNPPRVRKMKVVGIYQTGLEEFDKSIILGDIKLVQKMNDWDAETVGHYEVFLKDFEQITPAYKSVFNEIDQDMRVTKITEIFPQIFDWLGLLDRNIWVVLVLILVVASFNMISILLVMMMERTPMIGLLKALGSDNLQIRKIFIFNGLWIILRGILWGNIIGIVFCVLQYYYKIIPLNPESYYMSYVPISWNWSILILLNLATILLVTLVILIPTFIVAKMKPVLAMKFKD